MRGRLRRLLSLRVRTPVVFQMEAIECGAACLAAVLRHFGHWVSLEEMREACDVGRDGCSAADIVRAARQYRLEATGWRQDLEDLPGLALPAILFWEFRHFVVLEGIGKRGYYLNDPSRGRRLVDKDSFDRAFTGVALELEPGPAFRRTRRPPGVLRRLWPWVSGFRRALLFSVLAGLLLAAPGVAVPVLVALFVDDVLAGGQHHWSGALVGAMAATAGVVYLLTWLRTRALRRLSTAVAVHRADRFVGRLLSRSARFFARRMAGDLLARMHSIERVVAVGVQQSAGVTVDLTMSLAFLSLMFVYDATLAAIVVLIAAACGAAVRLAGRHRTDESHALRREQGLWTGVGLAGLRIIETLRATASEDDFFARWSGHQARELNARQRFEEVGHVTEALPVLFTALGGAAVLGIGGWYLMSFRMPLGSLIAFYVLAWNFLQPIGRLARYRRAGAHAGRRAGAAGGGARLPRTPEASPNRRPTPRIAVRTASSRPSAGGSGCAAGWRCAMSRFGFQRHRPPLIDSFDLTIEPGQRVAIVGPSGSGKSTLALLAAGIHRPRSGEILFDGMSRARDPARRAGRLGLRRHPGHGADRRLGARQSHPVGPERSRSRR